jgi:serine/threonine protein kinase
MKYCPACHKTYPTDYNVCPADQTGLQSTHELQPGMIIRSKYEILDQIGIGGMGIVYRGRHLTFNEMCAIKVVNEGVAGDANFLQRFQTEAVVTRKLRHPNAVRVDDFDYTDDGRPFIVMELVEGKSIGEILLEQGPFAVPRALRIVTQAAQALGVAHQLGVVHRDIKPGNILLTKDEQGQEMAKVLDFGIAKLREAAGEDGKSSGMTMTGMLVGTPLYMSPEQFMGKKGGEIDGRTDIYSLGVVLYQMVTGQAPFDGDTLYSLMMQHMEGNVKPPHERVPELHLPEALSQVILKAIDKSRDQRFQTAEEFIAAMDEITALGGPWADAAVESAPAPNKPVAQAQITNVRTPASTAVPRVPPAPPAPKTTPAIKPRTGTIAANVPPIVPTKVPTKVPTIASPPRPPVAPPVATKPAMAKTIAAPPPQPDSVLVKSAAQHVLLQPRKFGLKHFLGLVALLLAAVLVAGVGYLKYQSLQRLRIEKAVIEVLNTEPDLSKAALRVSVSNKGEVVLDGNVLSPEDRKEAENLAGAVPDVSQVINRILVTPAPGTVVVPAVSYDSLVSDGNKYMDDGKYDEAVACFSKAAEVDPSKGAKDLLQKAQQAQKAEELLLKNRR